MEVDEIPWLSVSSGPEVFHVYHLRRSGGHGVIAWLLGHHPEQKVHFNQCRPDRETGEMFVLENMIATYPGTPGTKAFELASFEDMPLVHLRHINRPAATAILLLRDPFNWFASRLQMLRKSMYEFKGLDSVHFREGVLRWKEYALEYINTAKMPHAVRVNFNQWYADQNYRRHTSNALGWQFTDEGFASRLGWNFSHGSSFGETDPGHLDLMNRWRFFRDDPEFLSFFDDDLFDLSKLIFEFSPDLPRRNQASGSPFVMQKQMSREEATALAIRLHQQHRYVEAVSICRQLIASGIQAAKMANLLADSLFALGRVESAKEAFEQAFQLAPSDDEGINQYLQVLDKLGDIAAAISVCRRGLDHRPDCIHLHQRLGNYLVQTRQFDRAIAHLRFVTDRAPTAHRQLAQLALAYHFAGDEGNALFYGANALAERDRQLAENPYEPLPGVVDWLQPLARFHPREGNKIIAFSLWGDDPSYVYGALRNAELCEEIYPGWVCRFYCDRSLPTKIFNRLQQLGCQVYLMPDVGNIPREAWRLLVADDPTVERFVLRNCNARLNRRSKAAVDEWLRSGKSFHIMRDSIAHSELMLAGMWGGVTGKLPSMQGLLQQSFANAQLCTLQEFLVERIWPLVRYDCLIHDTYYRYRGKPFPPGSDLPAPLHVGAPVPVAWDPPQVPN